MEKRNRRNLVDLKATYAAESQELAEQGIKIEDILLASLEYQLPVGQVAEALGTTPQHVQVALLYFGYAVETT